MAPSALAAVRAGLAAHTMEQCEAAADAARSQSSAAEAKAAAQAHLPGLDSLGL
jgi:phosphotransferase system enzyme I (PtsI)